MTPDSSVLVAGFGPWHDRHDAAVRALRGLSDLVAHAELEAYSVLTRLPGPYRAPAAIVAQYFRDRYPGARLVLGDEDRSSFVLQLAESGVMGGAVYDALIAETAKAHGLRLLTCDARATVVYARLGAGFEPV